MRIFCDDNHRFAVVRTLELSDGAAGFEPSWLQDVLHRKRRSGFTVLDGERPAPRPSGDGSPLTTIQALAASKILAFLDEPHDEPHCVVRGFFAAGGTLEELKGQPVRHAAEPPTPETTLAQSAERPRTQRS